MPPLRQGHNLTIFSRNRCTAVSAHRSPARSTEPASLSAIGMHVSGVCLNVAQADGLCTSSHCVRPTNCSLLLFLGVEVDDAVINLGWCSKGSETIDIDGSLAGHEIEGREAEGDYGDDGTHVFDVVGIECCERDNVEL